MGYPLGNIANRILSFDYTFNGFEHRGIENFLRSV